MRNSEKFLVLGHEGYLGNYLASNLDSDVLNHRAIYNNGHSYKYVINCIGKPDVQYCEHHLEESQYSNSDIILDINKYYPESKIINFSSYYVYDDQGLCNEFSSTTDKTNYSKHKLQSELYNSNGLNFRLGKLFGNLNKHQYKLTEKILKEKTLFLDDALFNPVSVDCVCQVLKNSNFISNNIGIFNLANDGVVSHIEYGKFIVEKLCLNTNIYHRTLINKPFPNHGNFAMSIDKIKKHMNIRRWEEELINYLESIGCEVYHDSIIHT